MDKKRYNEKYFEGSELLWPSEKEDKITRNFYRDLSHFSKNLTVGENKKLNIFQQVYRIIKGQGGLPRLKK